MIYLQLSKKMENRLTKIAKLSGRTKNFIVIQAIKCNLKDFEEAALVEKHLDDIVVVRSKLLTAAEAFKTRNRRRRTSSRKP